MMPLLQGAQYISAVWAPCLSALLHCDMRDERAERLTRLCDHWNISGA
jgi:hypothetical protein